MKESIAKDPALREDGYRVVVNDEEQYSIWPDFKTVPPGWRAIGAPATREECLRTIEREWTDLRPRSLRDRLAGSASA